MSEATELSSAGSEPGAPSRLSPWEWIRDRLGLQDLARLAAKKDVPVHRYTLFYYLGGLALFLFLGRGGDRNLAASLLPAERRRGVRERAIRHGRGSLRVADPLDPFLGREPLH